MNIKNYKEYGYFKYKSAECTEHKFGDVVISKSGEGVGIIIQIHEKGEYRTDKFGNCSLSEIRLATDDEIRELRPELFTEKHGKFQRFDIKISGNGTIDEILEALESLQKTLKEKDLNILKATGNLTAEDETLCTEITEESTTPPQADGV